jgi:hypothetical protein
VGRPVCATCKMILVLVRSKKLEILLVGQDSWAGLVTFRGVNRRPGPGQVGLVRWWSHFGRGEGMSGRRPVMTATGPGSGREMLARPDSAAWRDEEFRPAGVRGGGGGRSTAAGSNQFQGLWLLPLSLATGPGSNILRKSRKILCKDQIHSKLPALGQLGGNNN